MAVARAKLDALEARISPLEFERTGWQGLARAEALARLSAMGLPAKRDEYWRYTDPASLNSAEPVAALSHDAEDALFSGLDQLKLVFVDGKFDAGLSDDLRLEGITIERLATEKADIHWARDIYGVLEGRGQAPIERSYAALNTAFASDGVLIRVEKRASKPVSLIYINRSDASDVILHHCIKIETGAELTLLEQGNAA